MRQIKETLRLTYEAKLSARQVGRSLGVSHTVVSKYVQAAERAGIGWPLPEGWDEPALQEQLFPERRPRDKAKVEGAVLIAERRILAPLRHRQFLSVGEINDAIGPLLWELNEEPFQERKGSRRTWFEELDRPALQPLPAEPYELAEWRKAIVNIDHHVQVDWHFYSVPHSLVRSEVAVRLAAPTVQVFHQGRRVALHPRSHVRGAFTTDTAHQPKAHQRHGGTTPGQLVQRARALGPAVAQVAATIIETRPHPEQGYRAVLGSCGWDGTMAPSGSSRPAGGLGRWTARPIAP